MIAFFREDHFARSHTNPKVQMQEMIKIANLILLMDKGRAELMEG